MAGKQVAPKKIENLMEAFADSVEGLSDAEILDECRERGEDPAEVAARTRGIIQRTIQDFDRGKKRMAPHGR